MTLKGWTARSGEADSTAEIVRPSLQLQRAKWEPGHIAYYVLNKMAQTDAARPETETRRSQCTTGGCRVFSSVCYGFDD